MKNNVRRFRTKAGLTQSQLAVLICIANSNLSDIELGKRKAWPLVRRRIARALKVPEDELFPEKKR